jgi:hypothetical protein
MKSIVYIRKTLLDTDKFNKNVYCQKIDTNESELLQTIGTTLEMTSESLAETETFYETEHELYQMIYIITISGKQEELNSIATVLMSSRTTPVFGDVVILKYKIYDSHLELDECTVDDIETIFQRQIKKTCIYIQSNGHVELKQFQIHPLENETNKNIKMKDISFYNHQIEIFLKEDQDVGVNNRLSQMTKIPVCGDAYISWKSDKNIYLSMDHDLFDKISCLLTDGLEKYKLTESDKITLKNKEEYINIFRVIRTKYQEYK